MKKRNDQNVIVKRAVLVFILMFLVLLAALAFFTRSIVMREQLKASYTAEATVANVEAQLNRYLAESELLKSIVESGYEISDSDFAALSKLMYDEDGIIKAVELAPNGVVRSVYPKASNADVLGLNMLRHPERKVEANLAKESGQYTMPGRFSWCRAAPAHCCSILSTPPARTAAKNTGASPSWCWTGRAFSMKSKSTNYRMPPTST